MAAIYMGGRLPQIWLNVKRGRTEKEKKRSEMGRGGGREFLGGGIIEFSSPS